MISAQQKKAFFAQLQVSDLCARRSSRTVLHKVSFALNASDALILRGENGAGKSTLLRILAGLSRPQEGRITWCGEEVDHRHAERDAAIGYLGHLDGIKRELTVAENLEPFARKDGISVDDALHMTDLSFASTLLGRNLSAGQKRRTALARLLLQDAPLWLLDEPSIAMDRKSVLRLEDLCARHRAEGGIVVAATHTTLNLPGARILQLTKTDNAACS